MLTLSTATVTPMGRIITRKNKGKAKAQGVLQHVVTYQHPLSSCPLCYYFDREKDALAMFSSLSAKEANG